MIDIWQQHNVQVVSLSGDINAFCLYDLNQMQEIGSLRHCVVNLKQVQQLDSAGISWIVKLLKSRRINGGGGVLVWSDSEDVNRLIRLTRFDTIFPTVADVEIAMNLLVAA